MGVVGLPNVGKSTFFNLMSKLNVPAENFPFCTIEPNLSRAPVPDKRFNFLCKAFKPKSECVPRRGAGRGGCPPLSRELRRTSPRRRRGLPGCRRCCP